MNFFVVKFCKVHIIYTKKIGFFFLHALFKIYILFKVGGLERLL